MEKFDLESFPDSESARKMLSYVSGGFYDRSYVGKWLFQVMGMEYDKVLEIVNDLPAQSFPETATWGLMYHEIKWGLPVRMNLPYDERRRLIYQKRDYRAPMTPYRMEKYLEDATGYTVHVADVNDLGEYGFMAPHPNAFKVYFVGEGTLESKKIHRMLGHLKQSHTVYVLVDYLYFVIIEPGAARLKNIGIYISLYFWKARLFDGSETMDGTALMNATREGYALRAGLILGIGKASFPQKPGRHMAVCSQAKCVVSQKKRHGITHAMSIDAWQASGHRTGAAVAFNLGSENVKAIENVSVVTHSAEVVYFDGSVLMDGSVKMNKVNFKEDI